MDEIRSLADQLRNQIKTPGSSIDSDTVSVEQTPENKTVGEPGADQIDAILGSLRAFDNSDHKSMVHVRFDAGTLRTMNQFKMATGVDVTKLVAYAVRELFISHPELKAIIRQFIQNFET